MVTVTSFPKDELSDDLVVLHGEEVKVVVAAPGILEVLVVLVDHDAAAVEDGRGPQVGDGSGGGRGGGVQGVVPGVEIPDPVI